MGELVLGLVLGALLGAAAATWVHYRRIKTLGRFFSFAAHEINSPITAVNMTILNFSSGVFGQIPDDQMKWIELMREQVGRLNGMVGELRDLIHMELYRDLYLHGEDLSLKETVETTLRQFRRGAAQAGFSVHVSLPDDLPKVHADPERLPRSVTSLLFHARKFRLAGDIRLTARALGPWAVELRLEYSGPKISRAEAARSLELLYPALSLKGHTMSATGLGLGVTRAIMRRQGGELEFQVDPDGGSVLALRIPTSDSAPGR